MSLLQYTLLFFGLYLAVITYISWRARYHDHGEGFIIGSRRIGFLETLAAFVNIFRSGSALPLWLWIISIFGVWSFVAIIPYYILFAVVALVAPIARRKAIEHNIVTVSDLVKVGIGPYTAHLTSFISIYAAFLIAAAQLFMGGTVLGGLLGVGRDIGIVITAVTVASYLWVGGYMTLIRTDFFQFIVILILAFLAYVFIDWPTMEQVSDSYADIDWNILSGIMIGALTIMAVPDVWQRIFSADSGKTARNAVLFTTLVDAFIVGGIILLCTYVLRDTAIDSDTNAIFGNIFTENYPAPIVAVLFGLFIFSALMSTLDNNVYIFTSSFTKNVLGINQEKDKDNFIKWSRFLTIIMLSSLSFLAFTIEDLIQFLFDTTMYLIILGPFIIYACLSKKADKTTDYIMLILGILVSVLYFTMQFNGCFENMTLYIVPYVALVIPMFGVWLVKTVFIPHQDHQNSDNSGRL